MLDPTAAAELVQHLDELGGEGIAVVACEHRADYFASCPRVVERTLEAPPPPLEDAAFCQPPYRVRSGGIALRGITLRQGAQRLFENLDLELHGGEVTALVGRNGVGKTTLLRAIAGLHPFEGRIESRYRESPRVGLVYQNADWQIFMPTVRDEIRYAVDDPDEEWYHWLIDALGLRIHEGTPPLLLSEGEKKRLSVATILMHGRRDGVLLDEPTLGQDAYNADIMGRTARAVADAGATVLAATHDLAWAQRHADRLILLGEGRVLADGSPNEVFRQGGAWKQAGITVPSWLHVAREAVPA
jgi:energy-coupling factor transport system ATP-binding protein